MEQTISSTIDNHIAYDLSIQISLNGFSFCVQNEASGIKKVQQHSVDTQQNPERLLEKLQGIYQKHSFLTESYASVTVIFQNDLFTLVPKPLFDENELAMYINYSVRTLPTDFIAFDEIEKEEVMVVYVPYVNFTNFFFEKYGSFSYFHSQSVFLKTIVSQPIFKKNTCIFCNILSDSFELILLKHGEIIVVNTFVYQNEEDFLYYVLFTVEQYELDPQNFELYLIGIPPMEPEKEPIYQLTKKYIRNITLIQPTVTNPEVLKNVELKGLFTLLNANHYANYFRSI